MGIGKQKDKALSPEQILEIARQQNYMSNPNMTNRFGSTQTTFDGNDQANIVQTLSPEMSNLVDMQMGFVGQGPAQMGQFSNPFIEQQLQNTSDSLARTGGYANAGQSNQMGGFTQNPYQNPNEINIDMPTVTPYSPQTPPDPQGGGNGLDFGIGRDGTGIGSFIEPKQEQSALATALAKVGQGIQQGQSDPYNTAGQSMLKFLTDRSQKGVL